MATDSDPKEMPRRRPSLTAFMIPLAIILASVLFAFGYLGQDSGHEHDPAFSRVPLSQREIGMEIEDFSMKSLEGDPTRLSALGGKVVLINFWATWCPPCVKELPSLQKLSDAYADKGLVVIGINLDEEAPATIRAFMEKHSIKMRTFSDPEGEIADLFSVSGLPLTLVVDSDRKLLYEKIGDADWYSSSVRKRVEKWLSGNNG